MFMIRPESSSCVGRSGKCEGGGTGVRGPSSPSSKPGRGQSLLQSIKIRLSEFMDRQMVCLPHFGAVVILFGPTCIETRACPSFRKGCVPNPTELFYTELVFESIQITKTHHVGVADPQGLLERHGICGKRGTMAVSMPSLLVGIPCLLSILTSNCSLRLYGSGY